MPLLDFRIDETFQQAHTLSFKLPADDPKTLHLAEDVTLEFERERYYVTEIGPTRVGAEKYLVVRAVASWYRLGERHHIGDYSMTAVTPEYGMKLIGTQIAETGGFGDRWRPGQIAGDTALYSLDVTDASYLSILYEWARITGNEIAFDTRRGLIHMLPVIAGRYPLSFRYQRNLTGITQTATAPEVTRLYPTGRTGLTIAGVNGGSEYLEDYSFYTAKGLTTEQAAELYRKDFPLHDDNLVDANTLLAWGQRELGRLARPKVEYRARVADLTAITGFPESRFSPGDFATIDDAELGIQVTARVARRVRYPYEPHRNIVDLTNEPLPLPSSTTGSGRSGVGETWELFTATNTGTERYVSVGRTVLHRLPLLVSSGAEWIKTYSLQAVCEQDGILQITITVDEDGAEFLPTLEIPVTAGETIDHTISFADKTVPTGTYRIVVRAEMLGDSGLVRIDPDESHLWVHARGAVQGSNPAYDNSVTFAYSGAPVMWRVPDDVWEIEVEAAGSGGEGNNPSDGRATGGCRIVAVFDVVPGDSYQVRVGGRPWPNGGSGVSGRSFSGGGSTDIRPLGASDADVWIVAGGAGSGGQRSAGEQSWGGYGGFVEGGAGWFVKGGPVPTEPNGGLGGTQTEGGASPAGGLPFRGSFFQGGNGHHDGSSFHGAGGGAGGGWFGGGGGVNHDFIGGIGASGGGGGSSHVASHAFDLEYEDGVNTGLGYLTIRWRNPEAP